MDAIFRQVFVEFVDLAVAVHNFCFCDNLMDAYHQHVFIMRAVENGDFALGRYLAVDAPQKVVVEFCAGRFFKGGDFAALRIHGGEHLPDSAVLAPGVHGLQADKQPALMLGV